MIMIQQAQKARERTMIDNRLIEQKKKRSTRIRIFFEEKYTCTKQKIAERTHRRIPAIEVMTIVPPLLLLSNKEDYYKWWQVLTWVCMSSPVTIFPTVRRAGISTEGDWFLKSIHTKLRHNWHNNPFNRYSRSSTHKSSCTNLGHTPASITAWILSFVPSERYDNAQQASVKTSSSLEKIKRSSAGSAGLTCPSNIGSKNKLKDTIARAEWTDKEIKGHYLLKWRLWLTPTKVR